MPKPPSPPPRKQRVLNFVSPKVADIIFYELRDGRLPQYKTTPAYGTAHPDKRKYPNHKLVFVTPATASEDGWQKWYYAASRESQDDYNFEIDGDERLKIGKLKSKIFTAVPFTWPMTFEFKYP